MHTETVCRRRSSRAVRRRLQTDRHTHSKISAQSQGDRYCRTKPHNRRHRNNEHAICVLFPLCANESNSLLRADPADTAGERAGVGVVTVTWPLLFTVADETRI